MKKVLVTAVGALMLTVGGLTVANVDHTEAAGASYTQKGSQHSYSTYNSVKTEQTPEYKKLSTTVNLSSYSVNVVEDNRGKRITLFKDANEHVRYKTIFVKKTGMVKVIKLSRK